MAKSWLVGGRPSGQSYAAGATAYFQLFTSIEDDNVGTIRVFLPEALTLRNFAVRAGANTLSAECTVLVRKNDTTDTGLAITFSSAETDVEKRITGVDEAFAKDDDWVGKVICAAGTGAILLLGDSAECEPDNSSNTLSFMGCKSASSTNHGVEGDKYFAPFGPRTSRATELFDGTEATGIDWTSIGSFTVCYFQMGTGTITWTGSMVAKTRVNGGDGGCSITVLDTNDQTVLVDTTGTDTLVDGDDFNYVMRNGAGSGSNNIESMGVWLRSTNGQFLIAVGNRTGTRLNAGTTHYAQPGGELVNAGTSEAAAQMKTPFAMSITQMQVMSDRERTTGTSTVTLRKNGAATELAVTLPAAAPNEIGAQEDTGSVAVAVDDLLATEFVTGSGTNRDYCYVVYLVLGEEGEPPPSEGLLPSDLAAELAKAGPEITYGAELVLPSGTKRWCVGGAMGTSSWDPRLLSVSRYSRVVSISQPGLQLPSVRISVADHDEELTKEFEGVDSDNIRGSVAKLYILSPNAAPYAWFTGQLDGKSGPEGFVWDLELRPNDVPLRGFVPRKRITVADFPAAAVDVLDRFAPLIYGAHDSTSTTNAGNIPTLRVKTDGPYWYLLSLGILKDIRAVYKDGIKLSAGAWTRRDLTINGKAYTIIEFATDQGEDITADVDGYEEIGDGTGDLIANPANQFKHLIVNFVYNDYGAGDWLADSEAPVNATKIATAAAFYDDLSWRSSRRISEESRVTEIIANFLPQHYAFAYFTPSGEFALSVYDFRPPDPTSLYISDPWIRNNEDDYLDARHREESSIVRDSVVVQHFYDENAGKFQRSLEARDPRVVENSQFSLGLDWSEASA
jgi:hypothetical protein